MKTDLEPYVEIIKAAEFGKITKSLLRKATEEDIASAMLLLSTGNCQHNIVVNHKGLLSDFKKCYICGEFLE
jgi:hypothetical protein